MEKKKKVLFIVVVFATFLVLHHTFFNSCRFLVCIFLYFLISVLIGWRIGTDTGSTINTTAVAISY